MYRSNDYKNDTPNHNYFTM